METINSSKEPLILQKSKIVFDTNYKKDQLEGGQYSEIVSNDSDGD